MRKRVPAYRLSISARRLICRDPRPLRVLHLDRTPFRLDGVAMIDVGKSRKRSRILKGDEEGRLLAVADPYTADLMNAALETGARSGALRQLLWSDIEPDAVVFRPEIQKDRERLELPITPTLRAILKRRKVGPDGVELPATAYVFGNEIGEYVPGERAGELWARDVREGRRRRALDARFATHDGV